MAKAGFSDVLMGSETAAGALKHWNDVLRYMRGEVKLTSLPSPLQDSAFIIRDLIDEQMKVLQPILKDSNVKEDLIKNMGKYLFQWYSTGCNYWTNNKYRRRYDGTKNLSRQRYYLYRF